MWVWYCSVSSMNVSGVAESVAAIMDHSLKVNPTQPSWLRTQADIHFGQYACICVLYILTNVHSCTLFRFFIHVLKLYLDTSTFSIVITYWLSPRGLHIQISSLSIMCTVIRVFTFKMVQIHQNVLENISWGVYSPIYYTQYLWKKICQNLY